MTFSADLICSFQALRVHCVQRTSWRRLMRIRFMLQSKLKSIQFNDLTLPTKKKLSLHFLRLWKQLWTPRFRSIASRASSSFNVCYRWQSLHAFNAATSRWEAYLLLQRILVERQKSSQRRIRTSWKKRNPTTLCRWLARHAYSQRKQPSLKR